MTTATRDEAFDALVKASPPDLSAHLRRLNEKLKAPIIDAMLTLPRPTARPTVEAVALALYAADHPTPGTKPDGTEWQDWEGVLASVREGYMQTATTIVNMFGFAETEVAHEALADALHPEFGYEWAEPDGVIWKAVQQARKDGVAEGMRYVTKAIRTALRDNWTGRLPVRNLVAHLAKLDGAANEVKAMTLTDWLAAQSPKAGN